MSKLLVSHSVLPLYDHNNNVIKHDKLIRDGKGNEYDLPAIVILKQYVGKHNNLAIYSKSNIYARDLNYCQYCGQITEPYNRTIDHIIPRCHYNPQKHSFKLHSFFNVVTCCKSCNFRKGNIISPTSMKLLRKPTHPTRALVYRNKLSLLEHKPEQWNFYL